jgi:type VI protein secretion system component Hcp
MPIYMQIAGYLGDSTAKGYEGWFDVDAFSWGAGKNSSTEPSFFSNLNVTMRAGLGNPKLMLACMSGRNITSAIIAVTDSTHERARFTIETVLIVSFSIGGSGGEAMPELSLLFYFGKLTDRYYYQSPTGSWTSQTNYWDQNNNTGG